MKTMHGACKERLLKLAKEAFSSLFKYIGLFDEISLQYITLTFSFHGILSVKHIKILHFRITSHNIYNDKIIHVTKSTISVSL